MDLGLVTSKLSSVCLMGYITLDQLLSLFLDLDSGTL